MAEAKHDTIITLTLPSIGKDASLIVQRGDLAKIMAFNYETPGDAMQMIAEALAGIDSVIANPPPDVKIPEPPKPAPTPPAPKAEKKKAEKKKPEPKKLDAAPTSSTPAPVKKPVEAAQPAAKPAQEKAPAPYVEQLSLFD